MDAIKIAKFVVRMVISASVGSVIGNVIKASTPLTLSVSEKVMTKIGTFVLAGMAGDAGADYVMTAFEEKSEETKSESNAEKTE